MNKLKYILLSPIFIVLLIGCNMSSDTPKINDPKARQNNIFKTAFGSYGEQEQEIPIFNNFVKHRPDLFVFLGGNIYGDSKNIDVLKEKYRRLNFIHYL